MRRTAERAQLPAGFLAGARAAIPIVLGYVPVGMTFGLLARHTGIPFAAAISFSLIVFAGASQFMALNLLAAGAQPIEIVSATFLLNFRHFFMSGTLAQRLGPSRWRPLVAFWVTDESFAVASTRPGIDPHFLMGLQSTAYASWTAGTVAGYAAALALPDRLQLAMGTALYGLFVALLVPQVRGRPALALPAAAAGGLNTLLARGLGLAPGLAFVISLVLAAAAAASALKDGSPGEPA